VKLAYPKTVGSDRDQAEKCRKWSKGTDLPDPQSIVRFSKALKDTGSVSEEKLQNLRCWLMVSRTVAHLERESPVSFRGAMRRHLLLGMPDFDIGRLLSLAVVESGKPFSTLTMPALTLYERLKRTTEKEVGEQAKLKAELDQFERLSAAVEPEGRTRFHIEWMRGRWYVLSGKFDLALPHYESAAELANYRAGSQQKQIVEEALVLAGYLRKKALLKRLNTVQWLSVCSQTHGAMMLSRIGKSIISASSFIKCFQLREDFLKLWRTMSRSGLYRFWCSTKTRFHRSKLTVGHLIE